jgi:hypothetical protein
LLGSFPADLGEARNVATLGVFGTDSGDQLWDPRAARELATLVSGIGDDCANVRE